MERIIGLKDLKELFRTEKFLKFAVIAGIILILLTAFGGVFGKKTAEPVKQADAASVEGMLEKRLMSVLSNVEGVGKADIMVTIDCLEQTEYAGGKDMQRTVVMPQVRGVIIVCDGGNDIIVKEKVINAVAGVLGISTARISVIK